MDRSDWTGIVTSVVVHAVILMLLAAMSTPEPNSAQMGYIEVEFGDFAEGQPVRQAPERPEPEPEIEDVTNDQEEQPPAAPPEEAKPVELPDQAEEVVDTETVESPDTETIAPDEQEELEEEPAPEPEPEKKRVQPLGSGSLTDEASAESGDDGPGTQAERSAPFQIEGLNRVPIATTVPNYTEQVNALIRVRITVDPQGRIIRRIPLIKGNPSLEQAVMNALQSWRFNPLPSDAPQENQTGVITFRFRLK